MNLTLTRLQFDSDCTIGELLVDGQHACYVCEDVERPPGAPKVHGQTAIPRGSYEIVVTYSPHFNRDLPLLKDVPDFEGIRIHPGNTAADTEGCLLPGFLRLPKGVGQSRAAFEYLFARIQAALGRGEGVQISITGNN
jgi:hypothetical protein